MMRGIRNHNPGNVKDFGIPWDGMVTSESEKVFCVFQAPWYGIRAMAKIFLNYSRRHDLNTVYKIINRWAPSGDDNPTSDYADFVSSRMYVGPYQNINVRDFNTIETLVSAVIHFENGYNPYKWEIHTGIIMAGVDPEIPDYVPRETSEQG